MPYEALANVLSQIGRDYQNIALEQKRHDRDRQERLADMEADRSFRREMAGSEQQNALARMREAASLETRSILERAAKLPEVQQRALASTLGINPDLPVGELYAAIQSTLLDSKKRELASMELTKAETALDIESRLGDQRRELTYKNNAGKAKGIFNEYGRVTKELSEKVASDPGLADVTAYGDTATKRVGDLAKKVSAMTEQEFKAYVTNNPAMILSGVPKSKAEFIRSLYTNPVEAAEQFKLISDEEAKSLRSREMMAMRGGNQALAAAVQGLAQLRNKLALDGVDLELDFSAPWEAQRYAKYDPQPAPQANPVVESAPVTPRFLAPQTPAAASAVGDPLNPLSPLVQSWLTSGASLPAIAPMEQPGAGGDSQTAPVSAPAGEPSGLYPTYSLVGLLQRLAANAPTAEQVLTAPVTAIDAASDYVLGPALRGILTGDYSVQPTNTLRRELATVGEQLADNVTGNRHGLTWWTPRR